MIDSFLPAPEDIERKNNLLRVLPPKRGDNWGCEAMSRPDCEAGFPLQRVTTFVPRRLAPSYTHLESIFMLRGDAKRHDRL